MDKSLNVLKKIVTAIGIYVCIPGEVLANYTHYYDGNVKSVHVVEGATESRCLKTTCVIIQIENITNSTGTQCDTDGDRYMAFELENKSGDSMMSIAITAMASGIKIRAHANGCQGVWSDYNSSNLGWLKLFK